MTARLRLATLVVLASCTFTSCVAVVPGHTPLGDRCTQSMRDAAPAFPVYLWAEVPVPRSRVCRAAVIAANAGVTVLIVAAVPLVLAFVGAVLALFSGSGGGSRSERVERRRSPRLPQPPPPPAPANVPSAFDRSPRPTRIAPR